MPEWTFRLVTPFIIVFPVWYIGDDHLGDSIMLYTNEQCDQPVHKYFYKLHWFSNNDVNNAFFSNNYC